MHFVVTPEQEMLRDAVRSYLTNKVPPARVRELMESGDGLDGALWKDMAELGWMSMAVPEKYGGGGSSYLELGVLIESINEQRAATLAVFRDELRFLVDALVRERVLVGEGISAERVATIDAITPLVQEAIDQAFFRATQLIMAIAGLAVVLVGIVTFGLLRYSRSTGPSPGSGPSPDSRS